MSIQILCNADNQGTVNYWLRISNIRWKSYELRGKRKSEKINEIHKADEENRMCMKMLDKHAKKVRDRRESTESMGLLKNMVGKNKESR